MLFFASKFWYGTNGEVIALIFNRIMQIKLICSLCGLVLFIYVAVFICFILGNNFSKNASGTRASHLLFPVDLNKYKSSLASHFCKHSISGLNQYIWSHKAITDEDLSATNSIPIASRDSITSLLNHNIYKFDVDIVAVAIVTKTITEIGNNSNKNSCMFGRVVTTESEYQSIPSKFYTSSFFSPNHVLEHTDESKYKEEYELDLMYIVSHPMAIKSRPFNQSCRSGSNGISCWWEAYPSLNNFLNLLDTGVMRANATDPFVSVEPKFEVTVFSYNQPNANAHSSMSTLVQGVLKLFTELPLRYLSGYIGLICSTEEDRATMQTVLSDVENPIGSKIRMVYAYKNSFNKAVSGTQSTSLGNSNTIHLAWNKHMYYEEQVPSGSIHMPESSLLLGSAGREDIQSTLANTTIVCWIVDDIGMVMELLHLQSMSVTVHGFITNTPIKLLNMLVRLHKSSC